MSVLKYKLKYNISMSCLFYNNLKLSTLIENTFFFSFSTSLVQHCSAGLPLLLNNWGTFCAGEYMESAFSKWEIPEIGAGSSTVGT